MRLNAPFSERDGLRLLVIVFIGAVLFRAALALSGLIEIVYDGGDSWEYRELARSLLNYGVFGLDGVPRMNRQPGYPAFLALIFSTLGSSRLAVSAVQVVLDAMTCVLVVHMALTMHIGRAGVMTVAVLVTSCLYTAAYSMMMMTEVVYTFLVILSFWALVTSPPPTRASSFNATMPRVLLAAAALGAGVLVRPALAPSVALVGLLVVTAGLLRRPRVGLRLVDLRQPYVFGVVLVAIVAPWMARNYVVFNDEFIKPDNDQVTLMGYKTDIPTYRHWYTPEMLGYLKSNEEPFVMIRPYRPPVVARYAYPDERADLERVFARMEHEILAGPAPVTQSTLDELRRVTEQRYRAAPRLYVTGPVSRILKLWIAPRISAFWPDTSGHNSSMMLIALFTGYNLIYVAGGALGLLWGLRQATPTGFLFLVGLIAGHSWMYSFWLPMPQSRYAIPLFPLLALSAGAFVHQVRGRGRFALARGEPAAVSSPSPRGR